MGLFPLRNGVFLVIAILANGKNSGYRNGVCTCLQAVSTIVTINADMLFRFKFKMVQVFKVGIDPEQNPNFLPNPGKSNRTYVLDFPA